MKRNVIDPDEMGIKNGQAVFRNGPVDFSALRTLCIGSREQVAQGATIVEIIEHQEETAMSI